MLTVILKLKFSDEEREALARHYGKKGMANRETCRAFAEIAIAASMTDVLESYERENDGEEDDNSPSDESRRS
jgi:hypothetical protein